MIEAVKARLGAIIGERAFDVEPAPLRCWRVTIYSRDKRNRVMVELGLDEVGMRRKLLTARLAPALKQVEMFDPPETKAA